MYEVCRCRPHYDPGLVDCARLISIKGSLRPPQEIGKVILLAEHHRHFNCFFLSFSFEMVVDERRESGIPMVGYADFQDLTCRTTLKLTLQARRAQPCFPLAPSLFSMWVAEDTLARRLL